MVIGYYSPSYPSLGNDGGIGTYTHSLAHGLTAIGHDVHVVTPGNKSRWKWDDNSVTLHPTSKNHFPLLDRMLPGSGACYRVGSLLKKLAKENNFDIVEYPNWEGLGIWYGINRPTPLVVRLHTSSMMSSTIDGMERPWIERWEHRRERWLCNMADGLVTHSMAHRSEMARELCLDESRIEVVPHGIETFPTFRHCRPLESSLTVVFLGRLERRKGTLDLIKAIPEVVRQIPDVQFLLVGTDRPHCPGGRTHSQFAEEELPAEARSRIQFLGRLPQPEVDEILQNADLFVAPSHYESFGLVFLEAMRWGTPVIGTTAGGIPEIVEDGRSGRLVPPGDPGALAASIVGLLGNETERRKLGEAGRRRVEKQFTVESMARRAADLYGAILEKKR